MELKKIKNELKKKKGMSTYAKYVYVCVYVYI